MGSQFHHGHVSSSRLVKRSVRISRTPLSCLLHLKGYEAGSAFALWYILRRRSCRLRMRLSFHPCLPCGRRTYRQQGPFARRTLLRVLAITDPSATFSSSADFPGAPVIRPTLLRRFRGGRRRASPVAWRVLVTVLPLSPRRSGVSCRPAYESPCCLHPTETGSASGASAFRGHLCVRLRCGPVTRCHPYDGVVDGLQVIGFPSPCHPSCKASGFCLGGIHFPLNAPAFAGRTSVRRVFPSTASRPGLSSGVFPHDYETVEPAVYLRPSCSHQ
jgi:hypothetical protein